MKFKPSETYEGLLVQAKALARLVDSLENELSFYRSEPLARDDAHYKRLQAQLDSERDMNHALTMELENGSDDSRKDGE